MLLFNWGLWTKISSLFFITNCLLFAGFSIRNSSLTLDTTVCLDSSDFLLSLAPLVFKISSVLCETSSEGLGWPATLWSTLEEIFVFAVLCLLGEGGWTKDFCPSTT